MRQILAAGLLIIFAAQVIPVAAQDEKMPALPPIPPATQDEKTPPPQPLPPPAPHELRFMSVTGTSEITAQPDILVWNVRVTTTNPTLTQAKSLHDMTLTYVKGIVDENSAKMDRISIQPISINKREKYVSGSMGSSQQIQYYYECSTTITFRLKDLSLYTVLVTRFSEKPDINFSATYDCTDADEKRKQARKEALLNARDKAHEMADVLGLKVGKTLRIQETPGRDPIFPMQPGLAGMRAVQNGGGSVPIEGSTQYNGWVELVFELTD